MEAVRGAAGIRAQTALSGRARTLGAPSSAAVDLFAAEEEAWAELLAEPAATPGKLKAAGIPDVSGVSLSILSTTNLLDWTHAVEFQVPGPPFNFGGIILTHPDTFPTRFYKLKVEQD